MWNGKKKAITFSYDDGVTQDIRMIEILNRYGMKGTFNLNSALLGKEGSLVRNEVEIRHDKINPADVSRIYRGHEVAAHTLTHPFLPRCEDDEVVRQVEADRLRLSELCGYEVVGMAYPCGGANHDKRVEALVREKTGIRYARTIESNGMFAPQSDLFCFHPSVYHIDTDEMFRLGKEFLALEADTPAVFYIWGHSYEFDAWDFWDRFEDFCRLMSGRDDVFYGTNREVLLKGDRK
jgi:peptidoglycan/xylan/chitin deacetylase (PgdA/CDA1 family)